MFFFNFSISLSAAVLVFDCFSVIVVSVLVVAVGALAGASAAGSSLPQPKDAKAAKSVKSTSNFS